ncbi:MAG: flagellar assembly protein FliW [Clostridium sp.]|nr:flagellar assembly protein FliW [Clostridium sp.]
MKLYSKYHGTKEYDEKDVITFEKGLPGFLDLKKYILFSVEDNNIFSVLHSIDNLEIGFVVVSPFLVEKDYEFNIDDEDLKKLKITDKKDIIVLTTVCLNKNVNDITTNLKAPIVINKKQQLGRQLILDKEEYEVKHPLLKEKSKC